jgi:hypothetical protein
MSFAKRLVAIILLTASPACVESDHACDDGQIWNAFYESCVDTCPPNQAYDDRGICSLAATHLSAQDLDLFERDGQDAD